MASIERVVRSVSKEVVMMSVGIVFVIDNVVLSVTTEVTVNVTVGQV